jgi:hypothetical protein
MDMNVDRSFVRLSQTPVEPYFAGDYVSNAPYMFPDAIADLDTHSGSKPGKAQVDALREKAIEGKTQTELPVEVVKKKGVKQTKKDKGKGKEKTAARLSINEDIANFVLEDSDDEDGNANYQPRAGPSRPLKTTTIQSSESPSRSPSMEAPRPHVSAESSVHSPPRMPSLPLQDTRLDDIRKELSAPPKVVEFTSKSDIMVQGVVDGMTGPLVDSMDVPKDIPKPRFQFTPLSESTASKFIRGQCTK